MVLFDRLVIRRHRVGHPPSERQCPAVLRDGLRGHLSSGRGDHQFCPDPCQQYRGPVVSSDQHDTTFRYEKDRQEGVAIISKGQSNCLTHPTYMLNESIYSMHTSSICAMHVVMCLRCGY